jgi:hypothetical protein
MKPPGRNAILGTALLVGLGAVGFLSVHGRVSSRAATAPACLGNRGAGLECYEQYYGAIVATEGVTEAFAALKARYTGDAEAQRLCHAITHAIGRAAARKYSDVATAFSHGDNMCGSGYYHGVLQGFALAMGRDRLLSNLDTVCAAVPGKERRSLDYFNCVHGLGHALMAVTDDDLFGALHDCDGLTGTMEQDACTNGIFMENLIVDGAHGGHYSKYLRPGEPLYPCTAVDGKYKAACFDIQTSYALGALQGSFSRVFALCDQVAEPYRTVCDRSLGRDAATLSLNQVPATVAACNLATGREQRANCIIGAVLDFVYYYHSDVQAKALCAAAAVDVREECQATAAKAVGLF